MSKYQLEMELLYLDVDPFKERQAQTLINIIGGSRLNKYMIFSTYANMYFEENDHKHQYPIIEETDVFNRNKVNCLVFDLTYNTNNNGKFNKLFIYNTVLAKNGNYGYFFHNTKTGHTSQKYLLEYTYDYLISSLNRDFNLMLEMVKLDYYNRKSKAIKEYHQNNNLEIHIPNVKDYEDMLVEYKERMKIGFPNIMVEDYWNRELTNSEE